MARSRKEVKRYARKLRRHQTLAERRMWPLIFIGFLPQRVTPIGYVADYWNPLSRVIVELDGGPHFTTEGRASDYQRDDRHRAVGVYTIRVHNTTVMRRRPIAVFKVVYLTLVWQLLRWFWW